MYNSLNTRRVHVLNSYISYTDTRAGEHTVIFLHGSLTNSQIWRKVIPHVQGFARCLVPDLIEIGTLDKAQSRDYGFETHYRYLCEWMKSIGIVKNLVFVGHEWGAALAARWMYEHPESGKGLVHIEGILSPLYCIEDMNSKTFQELVKCAQSKELIDIKETDIAEFKSHLKCFIDEISVNNCKPSVSDNGYLNNNSEAIFAYFREIPVQGSTTSDIFAMFQEICTWLSRTVNLPKVFIQCDSGIFSPRMCNITEKWPNQTVVTIKSKHFPQESCPEDVGKAITDFLKGFQIRNYRKY